MGAWATAFALAFGCGGTSVHHAGDGGTPGSAASGGVGGTTGGTDAAGGVGNAGMGAMGGSSQPCVPAFCPGLPPEEGAACADCEYPRGCRYDPPGVAASELWTCAGGQWSQRQVPPIPACCANDAECVPGICVNTICEAWNSGGCFRDDTCPQGYLCSGAFVCGCAADCSAPDRQGTCVPAGAGCCLSDADCGAGECVAGTCRTKLAYPGCWRLEDCRSREEYCSSAPCTCGDDCVTPGASGMCLPQLH